MRLPRSRARAPREDRIAQSHSPAAPPRVAEAANPRQRPAAWLVLTLCHVASLVGGSPVEQGAGASSGHGDSVGACELPPSSWPMRVRESDFRPPRRLDTEECQEPSACSNSCLRRSSIWISSAEWSSPPARRPPASTSWCSPRAPSTRKRSSRSRHSSTRSASSGSSRACASARVRGAFRPPGCMSASARSWRKASRVRSKRRAVVSHPPEQAPSMVARRATDPPVPPRRRSPSSHPLVGGDAHSASIRADHGGRRGDHDRLARL